MQTIEKDKQSRKFRMMEQKWEKNAFKCKFCNLKYTIDAMLTHIKVTHAEHYQSIKLYIDTTHELTSLIEYNLQRWNKYGPFEIGNYL
jgi:hypothetical protein